MFYAATDDEHVFDPKRTSTYATRLLKQLSSMRDQAELCDFCIIVNGRQFFCHRFLLFASSDYFKAMFNGS